MRIFNFFRLARQNTAETAKERLQVLLALERRPGRSADFLPQLQKDLIDVIRKYVEVDNDKVSIELERGTDISLLEVNIELPASVLERKSA